MAQADGIQPSPPDTFAIYRGFYVVPGDSPLPSTNITRIDYFRSKSTDDVTYSSPQYWESGEGTTGWYVVDGQLDESLFYEYYAVYVFKDGSKSGFSEVGSAGQAQLTPSSSLNIDKLASGAYSTGLITSGVFRGVEFQTSNTDPRVQLDPTGLWATDALGNSAFYLHADGVTPAFFSGVVDAQGVTLPEASGPVGSTNQVQWSVGGVVKEQITGESPISGINRLVLEADPAGVDAFVSIDGGNLRQVLAGVGTDSATILNGLGESSFVMQAQALGTAAQFMGAFAACYSPSINSAWGAGKGEPIASFGQTTLSDTFGLLDGAGRYITPRAGLFLAFGCVGMVCGVATAITTSVKNNTTGYELGQEATTQATFFISVPICIPVVASAAGQSISMWNQVNQAVTLKGIDTQSGIGVCYFACGQIG